MITFEITEKEKEHLINAISEASLPDKTVLWNFLQKLKNS